MELKKINYLLLIGGQLIFDKDAKTIQWGKKTISLTNGSGTTEYPHTKEWSYIPISYCLQKLTQNEYSGDLNLRAKTLKLLEESIGASLHDFGFGNFFFPLLMTSYI